MTDSDLEFFHKLKHFIATGNVMQSWSKQEQRKVWRSAKNFIIKGHLSTHEHNKYIVNSSVLYMWHTDSLFL